MSDQLIEELYEGDESNAPPTNGKIGYLAGKDPRPMLQSLASSLGLKHAMVISFWSDGSTTVGWSGKMLNEDLVWGLKILERRVNEILDGESV